MILWFIESHYGNGATAAMDEQRKRLRLTLPQEMEESILALQKSRYPQQSLSQVLRLLLSLGLEQAAREQDRTPNGRTVRR